MTTKVVGAGSIKEGDCLVIEGSACKAVEVLTSKSGKHGHAKMRITAVGLTNDKKRVIVLPAHDNVEVPIIEKRSAQVLSISGEHANIMDSETYETFDLKIPEELKGQVVEGCGILYWVILNEKFMKQVKKAE